MAVYEIALERRTIRKYKQHISISREKLLKFVEAAKNAPSAANLQPIRYIVVDNKDDVEAVFENVRWAAYINPKGNPKEGEKPVSYIIMLLDKNSRKTSYEYVDLGLAAQTICLVAWEEGIGTCLLGAINRKNVREKFLIPEQYEIGLIVALGYIAENPVQEELKNSCEYYQDENNELHVPKRTTEEVVLNINDL